MIRIDIGDHRPIEPSGQAVPRGDRHMLSWSRERATWIARDLPGAEAVHA